MIFSLKKVRSALTKRKTTILILSVVFFFVSSTNVTFGQKRFAKSYPASKNVRLQLTNRTGTVTVEGWDKDEVRISAYLEAPAAIIEPQNLSGTILVNVVKDNQGRNEVGNVNFTVRVPYSSSVDIETKMGNLTIKDVNGGLVRARIALEGEITLLNIYANSVAAENGTGNIFFDGDIRGNGIYRFTAIKGDINLRIPFNSSFSLTATAPSTRSISLGSFSNAGLKFIGDGRRVYGKVGEGSATLYVTNQRGGISFISR